MDMKKKLEQTYIPDRKDQKEKILIGLSGLDSLVTAYLLKIQKYDLVAVAIVNSWEEFPGDQEKTFSCHLTPPRVDKLRDFCYRLGIPLQVVRASLEFRESVIESWLTDKLQGLRPKPCWSCHDLRMRLLFDKMKEAGATKLATGHFAKLFFHEAHKSVFVHTSSDELFDQSALLSRLPHEILSHLMLPLSDLTRKEVLKLAENFGITQEFQQIPIHSCLQLTPELIEVFEKKVPRSFLRGGDIMSVSGTENFGTHEGIHRYTFGEALSQEINLQVGGVITKFSYPDKKIIVGPESYFLRSRFTLKECHVSEEVSALEPLKGYLVLPEQRYVECWVFLKTLSTASLVLSENAQLIPGEIVSIAKKKGKNAKILVTGEIQLLALENTNSEGEAKNAKIDPFLDF